MDIRFLLVLLLPALVTAGTYPYEPVPFGIDEGSRYEMDHFGGPGDKADPEDIGPSAGMGAEFLNDGSAYANAAIEEYGMKAKTIEQSAKWYRNLLSEKQLIMSQVKKRLNVLRAMAAESLQSAEQYRKSAAEKSQTFKALETKAREAQSLSKEQAVQVNELRTKMNNELKQHLNCLINSRVAEANAEIDTAEVQRQRTWGAFLEKQAQDVISEAVKWDRISAESLEVAKKLKSQASAESAKGKEFDMKRKEAEDAANEADKKARGFYFFHMEFHLKSQAEERQAMLGKIKAKYLQIIAASMVESASGMEMFANLEHKDKSLWEKKTASVKAEAKLLEVSANKMAQNIEKLKASIKSSSKVVEKKGELVVQEGKVVKAEPVIQPKAVVVPIIIPEKKV